MTRTISFKELVKLIHPDYNKSIIDAGGKMCQAVLYKNKPEELYKLALRWGVLYNKTTTIQHNPTRRNKVIKPAPQQPAPPPRRFKKVWTEHPYDIPNVGDWVKVLTLNIIVMIVRVTPQRVYFYNNDKRTFASKKNIILMKEIEVEVK